MTDGGGSAWYGNAGKVDPKLLERRRKVAILWNRGGVSAAETARRLGVSPATITRDRQWLLQLWRKYVSAEVDQVVARELQRLEDIEAELWVAWERSKEPTIKTGTREKVRTPPALRRRGQQAANDAVAQVQRAQQVERETMTATEERLPDPRYMALVLNCQERRARLLGLDKAVQLGDGDAFSLAELIKAAWVQAQDYRQNLLPAGDDNGSNGNGDTKPN